MRREWLVGVAGLLVGLTAREGGSPSGAEVAGTSYVVYGKADTSPVSLLGLESGQRGGFAVFGVESFSGSQLAAAPAGDQNGDGFRDILPGRYLASPSGISVAGSAYVVFGSGPR